MQESDLHFKKDIFYGRTAVLATMHGKEQVIVPILKEVGIEVIVPKELNTDMFGTFTREIDRAGNQLEAARAKAHAALALTGLDLAIASEGSFGVDPYNTFMQSNLELVLLVDIKNNIEVTGHYRSPETNINGEYVSSSEEARQMATKWGFPEHGLIIKARENSKYRIYKDINTEQDIDNKIKKLLRWPFFKKAYIETDMRAHKNPTRMKNIAKAAHDLVKNINIYIKN